MLTLADLKPQVVEVTINQVAGDETTELMVELALLSYSEFEEIGAGVELPSPPEVPKIINGVKKMVRDEDDAAYQRDFVAAVNQQMLRRVTISQLKAGNFPELAGVPLDEQVEKVGQLPKALLQGLAVAMNRLHGINYAEVKTKAGRFRTVRRAEADDLPTDGVEPEPVAAIAANGTR